MVLKRFISEQDWLCAEVTANMVHGKMEYALTRIRDCHESSYPRCVLMVFQMVRDSAPGDQNLRIS